MLLIPKKIYKLFFKGLHHTINIHKRYFRLLCDFFNHQLKFQNNQNTWYGYQTIDVTQNMQHTMFLQKYERKPVVKLDNFLRKNFKSG